MIKFINGDLIPVLSGVACLGVDSTGTPYQGQQIFDFDSITPFNHIHQMSGIFHDPSSVNPNSGVLRFNNAASCFEVSTDGGLTFTCLSTGGAGGGVTSVGVLGDTNLTGAVDFATSTSGFLVIEDSSDASPLLWSVDVNSLSGLWHFPTQGFNGRVVNEINSINGSINLNGVNGIEVNSSGDTITIDVSPLSGKLNCFSDSFTNITSGQFQHNLQTRNIIVQLRGLFNNIEEQIFADKIVYDNLDTISLLFNRPTTGHIVILACR